jgi:hypothetical protein
MKLHVIGFALLSIIALIASAPAQAQGTLTRTFVSSTGSDGNPCTVAQPCATFAVAYAAVAPKGIVAALDPGKYGPLSIAGPVTINGNGWAAITAPASGIAVGVTIAAGATDRITLTGLEIDGADTGVVGIHFTGGATLIIEDCIISHLVNDGIDFDPNGPSSLSISGSRISDNGLSGIAIGPTGSGAVMATFSRVEVLNNGYQGIYLEGDNATGTLDGTAYESVVAKNVANGFYASSLSGHSTSTLSVFHSVSADNGASGLAATGVGATVRAAQSMVTGNAHGWLAQSSGVFQSYGDNYIDGNGSNTGSLTGVSTQ